MCLLLDAPWIFLFHDLSCPPQRTVELTLHLAQVAVRPSIRGIVKRTSSVNPDHYCCCHIVFRQFSLMVLPADICWPHQFGCRKAFLFFFIAPVQLLEKSWSVSRSAAGSAQPPTAGEPASLHCKNPQEAAGHTLDATRLRQPRPARSTARINTR